MQSQFRQGDVLVEETSIEINDSDFEKINQEKGDVILAYGEATGHAHRVKGDDAFYFRDKKTSKIYLVVNNDTNITHEEHDKIPLKKKSIYEVIRQREYTPEEIRYVND